MHVNFITFVTENTMYACFQKSIPFSHIHTITASLHPFPHREVDSAVIHNYMHYIYTVYLEILAVIKFGNLPKIWQQCIIGGIGIWLFVMLRHCIDIIVRNFDEH